MLTVPGDFTTALSAPIGGEVWLYEAHFTTGTLRLNTWGVDKEYDGLEWLGKGQLVEVSGTNESEDGGRQKFTITLAGVLLANIGLAMGDPAVYRGREIHIYSCQVDPQGNQTAPAVRRVLGFMDKVSIPPEEQEGGQLLKVVLECYANRRGTLIDASAFRVNNVTHQAAHPGELGLERLAEIISKPSVWLTAKAQRIQ
jgi:hypothetical protein